MAALTADANLTYTFASATMRARFSDFMLWRGDDPISAERENYTYTMGCDAELCVEYVPGDWLITTEFYSDGGDPSGYAAGIVNDYKLEYAGAFGAKRQ